MLLTVFMATTDRGPNETWAKKAVEVMMQQVDTFLYLPSDCIEHLSHLGVLGGLKLCDRVLRAHNRGFKYFASVAVICTTIRDLGQKIFSVWRTLHGDVSAVKYVKKLCPRCIAERWGSIDASEKFLLHVDIRRLSRVVGELFKTTPGLLNDETRSKCDDSVVDCISLEERKDYSIKMGRWRRQTAKTLDSPFFAGLVRVMNRSRSPFIHLSNFLKKRFSLSAPGHLAQLVCGKAELIQKEFETMLFGRWASICILFMVAVGLLVG